MALIVSAASGNFNAGATWVGGVVPTVGDEARAANGHTITITANATCDEVSNDGTGIFTLNSGVTLTANVTHKSTAVNRNCLQFTAASPAVGTIIGNVVGATVASSSVFGAVINTSSGTLNITGNATGGSGGGAYGCNNNSTGTLIVTGNPTGGSGGTAYGCNNNSTGTMTVVGTINASEFASGVGGGNRGQVTLLTGPFIASTTFGVNPINNLAWRWAASLNDQTYIAVPTSDLLATRNLVTPDNATNFPDTSDVRSGTNFGISGELSGACIVPNPASVAAGVGVDNTIGTLTTPTANEIRDAVWQAATSSLTTAGSIGERLKNCSTVESNGAALATALTAP